VDDGAIIKLKKINTARGAELHANLVCGICTCKVGFVSTNHSKEDANFLNGEYVVVTRVVTTQDLDIAKHHHMYEHCGSAMERVITQSQAERDPAKG
jgi:hypothetical protein